MLRANASRVTGAAVALIAWLTASAGAAAQAPPYLAADVSQTGVVNLVYVAPQGTRVQFAERVEDRLRPLGSADVGVFGGALLLRATTWRCDRLVRRFEASAIGPDGARSSGAFSVRTPSCRERLAVTAPRRVGAGRALRVEIRDRWEVGGVRAELCAGSARSRSRCRTVALPRDGAVSRRLRTDRPGLWRLEVELQGFRVRRTVAVGAPRRSSSRPRAPATLLATGDSTMQGLDSFLADRLGRSASVKSELRVGDGISKPAPLTWPALARRQVARLSPRATVVSIGANDGFPMDTPAGTRVECCGEPWIAEYSRRVRTMMGTYARGGAGRVLWLTLPAPRSPELLPVVAAVNVAVIQAGQGLEGVRVLRLDALLSPNGTYEPVIRHGGRDVRVRAGDGVHLSVEGTAIAADAVAAALRRLPGALSPRRSR